MQNDKLSFEVPENPNFFPFDTSSIFSINVVSLCKIFYL